MKLLDGWPCGCRSWTQRRGGRPVFVHQAGMNCGAGCDVQRRLAAMAARLGATIHLEASA